MAIQRRPVQDVSISHGGRDECGMPTVASFAVDTVVSDAYRCLRGGVYLTSHVSIDKS